VRIEAAVTQFGPGARVVALAFVVLGAVVVGLGFGGGVVPIVALAVIGVLVAQRRLLATIPRGERAPLWRAVVQTWWAPVAGLLGFVMILAAIVNAFVASNLAGRIVGSTLLLAFGVAMLFGLMRRSFDRVAGNALILLATVPPLLFFWVVVPPVAALVVWVGVLTGGFTDQSEPQALAAR
jgi:hypothetical protein